jgi:hypothetical protein
VEGRGVKAAGPAADIEHTRGSGKMPEDLVHVQGRV